MKNTILNGLTDFTEEDHERKEFKSGRARAALELTPDKEGKVIFVDFESKQVVSTCSVEVKLALPEKKTRRRKNTGGDAA